MNDDELIRALRRLDGAAVPAPQFGEALLERLRRERRQPRTVRLSLLAAAALLVVSLVGGVLFVGRPTDRQAVIPDATSPISHPPATQPPATQPPATQTAPRFLDLSGAITQTEITGSPEVGSLEIVGSDDAVWLRAIDNTGGRRALIRLDAATGEIRRISVECDGASCPSGLAIGPTDVWMVGPSTLVRVDRSGRDQPQVIARAATETFTSVAFDTEHGGLWIGRDGGVDLLSTAGTLLRSFDTPFAARHDLGYQATIAVPPVFGSLWAYDSAEAVIYRIDPEDGEATAEIGLDHCPEITFHRNYPGHSPLIYPLIGVDGRADAMVASCPMDVNHDYPGPMNVIDTSTNSIVARIDVGPSFDRGVVVDGEWWMPATLGTEGAKGPGLVRIDPITASVAASVRAPLISIERPNPNAVVAGGDLWVIVQGDGEPALLRVSPDNLP